MGTLIDTSVFVALERGQLDPVTLEGERDDEEIAMAAITASELLHGVHRLKTAASRARADRFVEALLALVPVIPFDLDVARVHARLDAELSAAGKAVGDADLQIAATAVAMDYRIATRDRRSFPRIAGVDLVEW